MSLTMTLPQVERELRKALDARAEVERRVSALQKIADGLRELNGEVDTLFHVPVVATIEPTEAEAESHPVGREAVRVVVTERPGIWNLSDLVDEVIGRGWAVNRKSVEVAVHRLTNNGEARRIRAGVYEFPAPQTEDGDRP